MPRYSQSDGHEVDEGKFLKRLPAERILSYGWTKVYTNVSSTGTLMGAMKKEAEMAMWTDENIEGRFAKKIGEWWFEQEEDAVLFMLQWGEYVRRRNNKSGSH